ncbi:murein biosynthesis integral membrane protein MurJ [Actinomadura macrotermitis]|uniref:Murein biosynthesis integral membrane protein MurJ n=1 Tax=Actinomadura macrotermitis TaxID=2585200 RepID=A0A7K0C3U1_9ACTN|nr:murein biosynthesis integral membrane protein MurJ [Actinomadura macrotermitis]MQY08120.1 hypothetical protein [Actinomadura macrotermitis]
MTSVAQPRLARSGAVMAIGTIFSRLTGFLRTAVITAALGVQLLGNAYQVANTVPYTVYELLLGGLLSSVFVPFLIKRRALDADGGRAAEQRLLSLALPALLLLTAAGVLAAPWLVSAFAGGYTGRQREVAVLLTRLLMTQIFFLGASGLAGTLLNVRRRFGMAMWAPVVNNLITMAAGLLFIWAAGPGRNLATVTDGQLTLLGAVSALGTAAQGALLWGALRSAGFHWRPRLDVRGSGFREAVRSAGWMMVYLVVGQAGVLVTLNVATRAGHDGPGLAAYGNALVVFQLPYAVIAVSVITALLPRMSAHVTAGRPGLVRMEFSRGLRLVAALLVPLSAAMAIFAVPGATLLFGHGETTTADARQIGLIIMVFAGLTLPFALFQLMIRVFYALGDTRTPGLVAVPAGLVQAAASIAILRMAAPGEIVRWLPLAYGSFYLTGTILAGLLLRRRLGGMDGARIVRAFVLMHLAVLPGAAFAVVMARVGGLPALAVGALGGGLLYVGTARLLGISEVGYYLDLVRARLRRGKNGDMTEILQYTAFTIDPEGGNPAGVVLDASGLSAADMLSIAAELGHSETAFLTAPPEGLGEPGRAFTIRYFSPKMEVTFCGHATVATGVALAERIGPGPLTFASRSGTIAVDVDKGDDGVLYATLTSVEPYIEDATDLDVALAALNWHDGELDPAFPPRVAYAGARHLILAAATRERLADLDYDFVRLAEYMDERDLTTVQLVWRESADVYHVRDPFPVGGVVEDPVTGAAALAFGAYLREFGLIGPASGGVHSLTLHQGEDLGRPGVLRVEIRDGDPRIRVSGAAVRI